MLRFSACVYMYVVCRMHVIRGVPCIIVINRSEFD